MEVESVPESASKKGLVNSTTSPTYLYIGFFFLAFGVLFVIIGSSLLSNIQKAGDIVSFCLSLLFLLIGLGLVICAKGIAPLLILYSVIIIVIGAVFGVYIPKALDDAFESSLKVCSKSDSEYDDWQTTVGSDEGKFVNLYFFDIRNAEDYLEGSALDLYVVGPYSLREYSTKLDVSFSGDTVTYQDWLQYTPYDGTVDGISSRSCENCNGTASITTINVVYLQLLSVFKNEATLFLGLQCTTTQIGLINTGIYDECNSSQLGDSNELCECCTVGSTCPDLWDSTTNTVPALFSRLSYFDSGTIISSDTTALGHSGIYSPLVITKTMKELAFGYPSSLAGYFLAVSYLSSGNETAFQKLANYTDDVREVCSSSCSSGSCSGYVEDARSASTNLTDDLKYLGLIDCKPFSAAVYANSLCAFESDSDPCICADGTLLTNSSYVGCCLKNGTTTTGIDLSGLGCMRDVPGYIDDRDFIVQSEFEDYGYGESEANTGCSNIDEINYRTKYFGESTFRLWFNVSDDFPQTGNPSQSDVTSVDDFERKFVYFSTATGGDGTKFPGTGITNNDDLLNIWDFDLTDGSKKNDSFYLFISQVRSPVEIEYVGKVDMNGVTSLQYRPSIDLLDNTAENQKKGFGTPYAGTASRHFISGIYLWVSRPYFYLGNVSFFLNQTDDSILDKTGGGINIYQEYDLVLPFSDSVAQKLSSPVLFTETFVDENGYDYFDSYINIEPVTGFALEGVRNLQASVGVWGCDPDIDATCSLAYDSQIGGCYSSSGILYPCSAANAFTPKVYGEKVIPAYYAQEFGQANDDDLDSIISVGKLNRFSTFLLVVAPLVGSVFLIVGIFLCFGGGK